MPIALDAFGGDNCPAVEVQAAAQCAREGIAITLVGERKRLESELTQRSIPFGEGRLLQIADAEGVITMDDSPGKAVRAKPDASMPKCFELVKNGQASAVVSAGNSGAMLACGLFRFGRVKGVDRPAITTMFPGLEGHCCILDMGANVECRALNLVQFAMMGACYAAVEFPGRKIRVGLLSNGSENSKGTELTRATDRILREHPHPTFDYIGYVEAKEIYSGKSDVIVTDGYTGNILLKVAEGSLVAFGTLLKREILKSWRTKVGAALSQPAFQAVRDYIEPDNFGGAPLLGVRGVTIISHGSSSVSALTNAVRMARRCVEQELNPRLESALREGEAMQKAAKNS